MPVSGCITKCLSGRANIKKLIIKKLEDLTFHRLNRSWPTASASYRLSRCRGALELSLRSGVVVKAWRVCCRTSPRLPCCSQVYFSPFFGLIPASFSRWDWNENFFVIFRYFFLILGPTSFSFFFFRDCIPGLYLLVRRWDCLFAVTVMIGVLRFFVLFLSFRLLPLPIGRLDDDDNNFFSSLMFKSLLRLWVLRFAHSLASMLEIVYQELVWSVCVCVCVCVCCVYVFSLPSVRRYCGEVGLLRPMESGRNGGRGCFFLPEVPGLSKSWTLFRNLELHISIRFLVPLSRSPLLACRWKQLPSSAIGYGVAAGRIWRQFRNCFYFFTESMVLSFFFGAFRRDLQFLFLSAIFMTFFL